MRRGSSKGGGATVSAALEIEKSVVQDADGYRALGQEPWLRFASIEPFQRSRFIFIRYATNLFDAPVRPLLRFWTAAGFREHILPGPCDDGGGFWIGHVPKACRAVWISPTNRIGPFDFHVTELRPASRRELASRMLRAPARLFYALAASVAGLEDEADLNWRWTLAAAPAGGERRVREKGDGCDTTGLARPRSQWDAGPRIGVVLDTRDASAAEIDASCRALTGQSYRRWRAVFLHRPADPQAHARQVEWEARSAFDRPLTEEPITELDYLCRLRAADRLTENALSCFVEHLARRPQQDLVYADEIATGGRLRRKPDFSPSLLRANAYIGRAAIFRTKLLAEEPRWREAAPEDLVERLATRLTPSRVGAIRRPLFHFPFLAELPCRQREAVEPRAAPSVGIVIPTRDRADLLKPCLESLFLKTSYRNYRVLVVDNESRERRTHRLLAGLMTQQRGLFCLRLGGPFNFSALCNAGAEAIEAEYLLFLNNDTEILTKEWIERLLFFASQTEIGAVGARLLYPNGRAQHVGIALGMGGVAGHFGAGLDAAAPGWLGRHHAPHEVSAVTGACLMVERRKFVAVGGFDAVNLPVEFNDVDLCLRLAERGWRTICNCEVDLLHRESASRGKWLRLQRVHAHERRFFQERWRARLRDDPYFHPGFSLYRHYQS